MDLRHPVQSLVPSLDSAVLEVLAGTESGLGISRIQKLAGRGSWAGLQRVLDRLVRHGLILSEPTNHGFAYSLNREHVLTPAVLMAVGAREELLARLTRAATGISPQPEHASVFGSFARGEGSPDSDIDLFLVMPDDYGSDDEGVQAQLQAMEDQVLAWTGNRLEVLILDRSQTDAAVADGEPVLASIREESVTILGPDADIALATRAQT